MSLLTTFAKDENLTPVANPIVPDTPFGPNTPAEAPMQAPEPKLCTPNEGTTEGDTFVTITGGNLTLATTVLFGGQPATSLVVVNSRQINCRTPHGDEGPATIEVVDDGTAGSGILENGFTYTVPEP